jgi:cytochrome c oxidase assembly protein subunit 15
MSTAAFDLAPAAAVAALGAALAVVPLAVWWRRHRGATLTARVHALTLLTLLLTFDLVLFGAFTRLTDSGLGCPDWPGCYGSASPLGAAPAIDRAAQALPEGPVTTGKAWIEMTHRYLATGVGALIAVLAALSWLAARRQRGAVSPGWAAATFAWVCVQGAFGALTVSMKLYPAIVTAHLLGGLGLLALLAVQAQWPRRGTLVVAPGLLRGAWLLALLSVVQLALGGWVSTNYAVLACTEFPTCQGAWWPAMDFESGFTLLRGLGTLPDGGNLPFAALTAIHQAHRIGAVVVLAGMALLAWRLQATGVEGLRRFAAGVVLVALWQLASGLGNVLLGWPLLVAVAHTAGAAAWAVLLASLITRTRAHATAPLGGPIATPPAAALRRMHKLLP